MNAAAAIYYLLKYMEHPDNFNDVGVYRELAERVLYISDVRYMESINGEYADKFFYDDEMTDDDAEIEEEEDEELTQDEFSDDEFVTIQVPRNF